MTTVYLKEFGEKTPAQYLSGSEGCSEALWDRYQQQAQNYASPVDGHTLASGLPERKKKNGSNEQSTDNNIHKHTLIQKWVVESREKQC